MLILSTMDKKIEIKKYLPTLALAALLIAFSLFAFFAPRRETPEPVAANFDAEAERAFVACEAYVASHGFTTELTGTLKAKVFGVPYTQKVTGSRTVRGDDAVDVSESYSAFVKAGLRREKHGDRFLVSVGKYKKKKFNYGEPDELSKAEYALAYGKASTGLVKYEFDGAVISAAAGDEEGVYVFSLDPKRATEFCKREVRTALEADEFPEYESVEITLRCVGDRPVSVTSRETFRIDKFGGTHVTAEYVETFVFDE